MDERLELSGNVLRGFVNTQMEAKGRRLTACPRLTFVGCGPGLNHLTVELDGGAGVEVLRIGTGASVEHVREVASRLSDWYGLDVLLEVVDDEIRIWPAGPELG